MNRSSSSVWVRGIADMFASQGLDVPRLFADAQLDIALLDDLDARIPVDSITHLWELALTRSGNPALGVDRELSIKYMKLDAVGYAMLACATLNDSLALLSSYFRLVSDAMVFTLERDGPNVWLVQERVGHTRPLMSQQLGYSLLSMLTLCRWLTRTQMLPLQVQFGFPQPVAAPAYGQAFGCPAHFGQSACRMLISGEHMALPLPSHSPAHLELHRHVLDTRLGALSGHAGISRRVTEEIIRLLHMGAPRRADIASVLAMTDRTLQRRLSSEQTSFQQLLESARLELARKYLA